MSLFAAIGNVVGGVLGANASKKAAKQQAKSTKRAIQSQENQLNAILQRSAPTQELGFDALLDLASAFGLSGPTQRPDFFAPIGDETTTPIDTTGTQRAGDFLERFKQSPTFQLTFQTALDEARRGVEARAGASGINNSGATLNALTRTAGNLANNTIAGHIANLFKTAGLGGQSAAQANAAQTSIGRNIAGLTQDIGNARAQGTVNSASALNKGFESAFAALDKVPIPGLGGGLPQGGLF